MTNAARCTYNTRLAGWMSAFVATATFWFLQQAYDRVPLVVPISFEAGSPYAFAAKTPGLVYLPFGLQVVLGLVFAAVVAVVLSRRTADAAQRAGREVAEHTAEAVALLAVVWIAFQGVNAWRLTELWRHTFDPFIEAYVFALLTAVTLTLVIAVRVVLKVQALGGAAPLRTPVLEGRRPLATAGLAALLALGIGAPLALLSVVWGLLTRYA